MVNEVAENSGQTVLTIWGVDFYLSDEVSWTRDDFSLDTPARRTELNQVMEVFYGRVICAYERHSSRNAKVFILLTESRRSTIPSKWIIIG